MHGRAAMESMLMTTVERMTVMTSALEEARKDSPRADAEESEPAWEIASVGSGRLTVEWLEVVPVAGR